MPAPENYAKEYCDEVQKRIDSDFVHVCTKIDDLKDNVKSLNGRLWIGLLGIVINIVLVLLKTGINWR